MNVAGFLSNDTSQGLLVRVHQLLASQIDASPSMQFPARARGRVSGQDKVHGVTPRSAPSHIQNQFAVQFTPRLNRVCSGSRLYSPGWQLTPGLIQGGTFSPVSA